MSTTVTKSALLHTFGEARQLSFQEKKAQLLNEDAMNSFLDAVLDLKAHLAEKTTSVENIVEKTERVTWLNNVDEASLMVINDLIAALKDLRSSLIRQYIVLDAIRKKGVAKDEIKAFKNVIDDVKESYEDLESVFFYLPSQPKFVETTKKLTLA